MSIDDGIVRGTVLVSIVLLFLCWIFGGFFRKFKRQGNAVIFPPRMLGYVFALLPIGLSTWFVWDKLPDWKGSFGDWFTIAFSTAFTLGGLLIFPTPFRLDDSGISGRLWWRKRSFAWNSLDRVERVADYKSYSNGYVIYDRSGKSLYVNDSFYDSSCLADLVRERTNIPWIDRKS